MNAAAQDLARAAALTADEPPVRLVRGDTVKLEPVHWLWPGFLPAGMLTILGGAPGCGKTTIALSLAATVTRGGEWPDGSACAEPGDVLIWSGEDAPSVTAARLWAAGADMNRVFFVDRISGEHGEAFDPGRDMPLLEETARKLQAPRLLILDPVVSAVAGDSHKGAEVRRSLQPVVDLAHRLGCAVLGITHFSKGTAGRDPVERVTGSIAFAALARVVLVAAKVTGEPDEEDEQRRILLRAKSNIGPDDGGMAFALMRVEVKPGVEGQRVCWLEVLHGSARDLLAHAEANQADDDGTATGVDSFLRGLLASGPRTAKALIAEANEAGYPWRTVQKAATRLGVERRKKGMKGGWLWGLTGAAGEPRVRNEGAEGTPRMLQAPSASSVAAAAPSDDFEAF